MTDTRTLSKNFRNRIKREGIVDTKKYRYVLDSKSGEIKRIPYGYLDTSSVSDKSAWTTVGHI